MAKAVKAAKTPAEIQQPKVLAKILASVELLYIQYENKFMEALNESEKKKIQLQFVSEVDLSETPGIETKIKYKDKATEGGLLVVKSFTGRVYEELENPNQPRLPGSGGDPEAGE